MKLYLDREKLAKLYLEDNLSQNEIADLYPCSRQAIQTAMKRYSIPTRSREETLSLGRFREKNSERIKELWQDLEYANHMSEAHLGQPSPLKGKPIEEWMSPEGITNFRETQFKKGENAGENHPNWQGGISFEPYGAEFCTELKEIIRKRDSYTCQLCGINQDELEYKLHVHHIDHIKTNNNPSNLTSLCRNCHMSLHWDELRQGEIILEEVMV